MEDFEEIAELAGFETPRALCKKHGLNYSEIVRSHPLLMFAELLANSDEA